MDKVILVAVAMKNELKAILKNISDFEQTIISGIEFFKCKAYDETIVYMLTGVGTINTAYAFGIACSNFNIGLVINCGIAGGVGVNIHKNTLLFISECISTGSIRTGIVDKGIDISKWEYITFTDGQKDELQIYKSDKNMLNKLCKKMPEIVVGRCGSSDIWNRERDVILNLRDDYDVVVSDMETIALYKLCNKLSIPIFSFKVISDNTLLEEAYDRDVLENNELAVKRVFEECINIYKEI